MAKEKYLLYVASAYVPKNQLHKDVHAFFEANNHKIYNDLSALKKLLKENIQKLNESNSRCKPVEFHYWESDKETIVMGALPQITVHILKVTEA